MSRGRLSSWIGYGAAAVLLVYFAWHTNTGHEVHRALVYDLLHVPADAALVGFRSNHAGRNPAGIEVIIQFTPAQYDAYVAALHDPEVWAWRPFAFGGLAVVASPSPNALKWGRGVDAIYGPAGGASWVRWGHLHDKALAARRKSNVTPGYYSFCFAVDGAGAAQRVDGCTAFPGWDRPSRYVRAELFDDDRRLFVYVN